MRIAKTTAIALIALAFSAGAQTAQAQAQENYVWITNTNGITWKADMTGKSSIWFSEDNKHKFAQIVVPEHASIHSIDMTRCHNLTNLIYRPPTPKQWKSNSFHPDGGTYEDVPDLLITPSRALRTIAMQPEMMGKTYIVAGGWISANILTLEWTTNWQAGDPPKMEIRTTTTAGGREEVEVVWREGSLQHADAVNGKWKDYIGSSPYRFPLAHPKDIQFFRIKPEEEEEPDEESQ